MQYGGYFEMGYYGGYGQQYPGNRMDGYGTDSYNSNMPDEYILFIHLFLLR